jgi:predicted nucleotidyltransferase
VKIEADLPILSELLEKIQAVLEQEFVGFYLHGSLVLGDFDLTTSDIDFAVVTRNLLEVETISKLEVMHKNLLDVHPETASMLEGAYIPSSMIRHHDKLAPAVPHIHGDAFYLAQLEPHWVLNRAILQERGVTLAGPNPISLIDPIPLKARQRAIRDFLREWWQPMLTDSNRLEDAGYRVYAVQTMARALCTLETGELLSKPGSIRWTLENLSEVWRDTIYAAQNSNQSPSLQQTKAFLKHVIEFGTAA